MSTKILYQHYNNFSRNCKSHNEDAINHAWLFIKEILSAAYGVKENEFHDNMNAFVSSCISDRKLGSRIQEIRLARNKYQHGGSLDTLNYDELAETIELFIKYINANNAVGFRWKLEDSSPNQRAEKSSLNMDHIVFEVDAENAVDSRDYSKIKFVGQISGSRYQTYPIAYGDSMASFIVKDDIPETNEEPIFSVIHNILVRGNTIPESEYLKRKRCTPELLEKVYIYEILILRAICSGKQSEKNVEFPKMDTHAVQLALADIHYYKELLMHMCNESADFPHFIANENLEEYCLKRGNAEYAAELAVSGLINPPVMISRQIAYSLNNRSVRYFNKLLCELFGINKLREGQYETLKSIFNTQGSSMIVLPTGYGKSLIYQYFAILQPKVTFVVSPTQTLIMDQLLNLKEMSFSNVLKIISADQIAKLTTQSGRFYSVLAYMEPKVFESESVFSLTQVLYKREILNAIAIDEFHQISVWGHKFDASYFTLLHQLLDDVPKAKLLLFSATSSRRIREDLLSQFRAHKVNIVQPCTLVRDNISYHICEEPDYHSVCTAIRDRFASAIGSGNSYDTSITETEPALSLIICNDNNALTELAAVLYSDNRLRDICIKYSGEKYRYLSFRNAETRILLTNDEYMAGINIPFLRNVIIAGFPPSKEWLYQESGRVGRGGEPSNVDIYYCSDSADSFNELLGLRYTADISDEWKYAREKYKDLSNIEFLYSMSFTDAHIEEAQKGISEIKKYIYFLEGKNQGSVIGTLSDDKKEFFNYSLFLIFFLGIIEKWLFKTVIGGEEYRFYINNRFYDGYEYFYESLKERIRNDSYDREVEKRYLSMSCTSFDDLVYIAASWLNENGYCFRRQMTLGTYQLVRDAKVMDSNKIEENLEVYFNAGSQGTIIYHSDYSATDYDDLFDVAEENFIEQKNKELFIVRKPETEQESKSPSPAESKKAQDQNIYSGEAFLKKVQQVSPDAQNIPKIPRVQESQTVKAAARGYEEIFTQFIMRCRNMEKYDKKFCEQFANAIATKYTETFTSQLRAALERELEYKYDSNCDTALFMIDVLHYEKQDTFFIKMYLSKLTPYQRTVVLDSIKPYASNSVKKEIDNVLIQLGKERFYFRGLWGRIKLLFI